MPKVVKKKLVAKKKAPVKKEAKKVARKPIGKISHYFDKIGVAVIELSAELKVGDKIVIEGHDTSFEQEVKSMQIEHDQVKTAKKGQSIGLKVKEPVKEHYLVYKS